MSAFFALGIAMDNTAQLVVPAQEFDRVITITGNQIAIGFDNTVYDTSGLLLLNDVPYLIALPANRELWAKAPTGALRIFVGGSLS